MCVGAFNDNKYSNIAASLFIFDTGLLLDTLLTIAISPFLPTADDLFIYVFIDQKWFQFKT